MTLCFATPPLLFRISHEGGGGGGLAYLWRCAPWVVSPALSRMGRNTLEPTGGVLRLSGYGYAWRIWWDQSAEVQARLDQVSVVLYLFT